MDEPMKTPAGFSAAWEPVLCDTFHLEKDLVPYADCGYVTVPELREKPDGPTIKLAVVRIRSISEQHASDPLFMEQGGPGGATITYFNSVYKKLVPILKTRDVVLVDQRGTRYSQPYLFCPGEQQHKVKVLKGEAAKDDFSYLADCKAEFEKTYDLNAFNTKQNADDMFAVAEALGYRQFNYFGVSYGTLLGQYVMNQASAHPGMLRSVILDGVVPLDVDTDLLKGQTASRAMREFFAACAADPTCSKDFPDLEKRVLAFADQLNAKPADIAVTLPDGEQVKTTFDGGDLTQLIFSMLYATPKIMMLPAQLDALLSGGDWGWVEEAKSAEYHPGTAANLMHLTMKCPRHNNVPRKSLNLLDPALPQVTFLDWEIKSYDIRCAILGLAKDATADYAYPTAEIPTLLLSGMFDPATPPEFAEHVRASLKQAYAYTMGDTGHGAYLDGPTKCAEGIALSFLADPSTAPDGSCAKGLKPHLLGRVTPIDELTLVEREVAVGITAMVPSQWATIGPLIMDPNDTLKSPTGTLQITLEPGDSAEGAINANSGGAFAGAKVIAADQPLGAYNWTTVETDVVPGKTTHVAAALLPDGKGAVMVKLFMPAGKSEPIVAALWEPILSSVKAE